jgi:hypothetical protein
MNKKNELTQLLIRYVELQKILENDTVDIDALNIKLKQITDIRSVTKLNVIKSNENMKGKLNPDHLEIFMKIRSMDSLMGLPPFSLFV